MTLALAMILDALLGEPRWLWDRAAHPAVLMGRAVDRLDRRMNHGTARRMKGAAAMAVLSLGALVLGWGLGLLGPLIEVLVVAVLLAQRSLVDHVRDVADALRLSTGEARIAVARIVGRDTAMLDESGIARAAIESAAENFSDGVVAPTFWNLAGGLPGLLLYKITNTADSMIGYRNDRHAEFGWAAARFDDLLNLIPARLTALLMMAGYGLLGQWRVIAGDARLHRSPNAGWPEAAMARALGVALSGPRSYDGQMREFPYVNDRGRKLIGAPEVEAACTALWRIWGLSLLLFTPIAIATG